MSASPGLETLLEIARATALGISAVLIALIVVGALGYLWMCTHATRQWNGHEGRWARPPVSRR